MAVGGRIPYRARNPNMEVAVFPNPLHPAVVHFPIVLMTFLPLAVLGALWALRRGVAPLRAWGVPTALAALLTLSAWAAVQSGEAGEEQAEQVVGEQVLHPHEEAGERFLVLSGIVSVLMAAGLLRGAPGRVARVVGAVGALALLVAGYQVGHSGGRVAYGTPDAPGVAQVSGGGGTVGGEERAPDRAEDDD